ncbi:uncharacterized protein A4U43_C01F24150 [Asparagus officinalis]|uniref:Uncharacterized protein n=1 Tax=Asparagus officinalis TaxID=4686 RepID=A0A5P1FS03_ASPOF|nr:uncharacterized protein A4U43_C01F24150 [Asparagus officinalis]
MFDPPTPANVAKQPQEYSDSNVSKAQTFQSYLTSWSNQDKRRLKKMLNNKQKKKDNYYYRDHHLQRCLAELVGGVGQRRRKALGGGEIYMNFSGEFWDVVGIIRRRRLGKEGDDE